MCTDGDGRSADVKPQGNEFTPHHHHQTTRLPYVCCHLNHQTGIARSALNLRIKLPDAEAGDRFPYYCMSYKRWSTRTSSFVKFMSVATPLEEGCLHIHLLLFIRLEHSVSANSRLTLYFWVKVEFWRRCWNAQFSLYIAFKSFLNQPYRQVSAVCDVHVEHLKDGIEGFYLQMIFY